MESRLRVLLVDDNPAMREGMAQWLQLERDIEVVGGAGTALQAMEMAQRLMPDVIAVDLNLGGEDGRDIIRAILDKDPKVKIIGLSMFDESEVGQSVRDSGACAYVSKARPMQDFVNAIRACRGST